MELLILVFIGISYSVINNKVSSLMVYFFIQSLSSFLVLVSYLYSFTYLFSFALVINLGIFPFMFWYLSSLLEFSPYIFFLAVTFHNIPALYIISNFSMIFSYDVIWFCMLLSAAFSGVFMVLTSDIRLLLTSSSVGNSAWMLLANESSFYLFLLFLAVYGVSLLVVLLTLGSFYQPNPTFYTPFVFYFFFNLSGLPPLPLFFVKLLIIVGFISFHGLSFLLLILLGLSSLMTAGYITYLINDSSYQFSYASLLR